MSAGFKDIPNDRCQRLCDPNSLCLDEVSVTGMLQVSVDDSKVIREIGGSNDDDVEVVVTVTPRATALGPNPQAN